MDNFEKFIMACMGGLFVLCIVGLVYAPPPQPRKFYCDCNKENIGCKCAPSKAPTQIKPGAVQMKLAPLPENNGGC